MPLFTATNSLSSFYSHSVQCGVLYERDTAYNRHSVARITEQAKFQDDCCVCTSLPIIPALFSQTHSQTEADIPDDFLWDPRYPFILYACLFHSRLSRPTSSFFHLCLDKYLSYLVFSFVMRTYCAK